MQIAVGMSGYAYAEWKGSFYPADLPADRMLAHYATRFATVEINNTFYRMPSERVLLDWAAQVPPGFTFTLKASRRITHDSRLQDVGGMLDYLVQNVAVLGSSRGPLLFQLPPNFKKDLERLRTFLALLPLEWRVALECRHPSWAADGDVLALLGERGVALVASEQDDTPTPLVPTAGWGYVRLHRAGYTEADLRAWAGRIRNQRWSDCYVYFKHEAEIAGPAMAEAFAAVLR
jgi:uncharacterized protein YecE (DUF72 family)